MRLLMLALAISAPIEAGISYRSPWCMGIGTTIGATAATYALGRYKSWRYNKSIATLAGCGSAAIFWYLSLPKLKDIKQAVLHLEQQAANIQDSITRTRITLERRFDAVDTKINNIKKTASDMNHMVDGMATHEDVQRVADLIPPMINQLDHMVDTSAKINGSLERASAPLSLIELIAKQLGVEELSHAKDKAA